MLWNSVTSPACREGRKENVCLYWEEMTAKEMWEWVRVNFKSLSTQERTKFGIEHNSYKRQNTRLVYVCVSSFEFFTADAVCVDGTAPQTENSLSLWPAGRFCNNTLYNACCNAPTDRDVSIVVGSGKCLENTATATCTMMKPRFYGWSNQKPLGRWNIWIGGQWSSSSCRERKSYKTSCIW